MFPTRSHSAAGECAVCARQDLGHYDKICDDDCQTQFAALPQEEKDKYGYEYDLMVSRWPVLLSTRFGRPFVDSNVPTATRRCAGVS